MAKREYLDEMRQRYRKARSRREKSQLLDEICATCGFHRKHVLRALRKGAQRPVGQRRRGPAPTYAGKELVRPLKIIWRAANWPCSKRLKAILPLWLRGYEEYFGKLDDGVRQKLLKVSASTLDRLLVQARSEHAGKGRATTKPGTLLRNSIPIKTGQWDESRPGFIEGDTVAHCGGSMAGQFAWTLDCVDIATGWTEQRAVWAKSETGMLEQLRSIEKALPFELKGFDSDNGGEFINHTVMRHYMSRQTPVQFTRSRAYKKNDNAHIEQKNWTHVRQWLGYHRIDKPEAVGLMNELYENEWRLYHNFYCPSVKLLSKERVGAKTIKKHDAPKTPYQRILESPHVTDYAKRGLERIYRDTNPFVLRRHIEHRLKELLAMISSKANQPPEDPR